MRKITRTALTAAAVAATAAALTTAPASAAPLATWSSNPGGAVTGNNSQPLHALNPNTGVSVVCPISSASGSLQSGSGLSGVAIASVTSVTSAGCAAIGIASTTITASASPSNPWTLDAVSYSSGVTTGTLNNVEATATINASPPCTVTVGGPGGGPGTINGTFTNSTDVLSVSGSNLEVQTTAGGGCAGLANVGDPITLAGAYQLTSDQHITSP